MNRIATLLCGVALGGCTVFVGIKAGEASVSPQTLEAWALPQFAFHADDNHAIVQGTLMGNGVGYSVNTQDVECDRAQGICHVLSVEEIGFKALGTIDKEDWKIRQWTSRAIVADTLPTFGGTCSDATMTIDRVTQKVAYTATAKREAPAECPASERGVVYKWSIGNPAQP